jgi:hypothetical protein
MLRCGEFSLKVTEVNQWFLAPIIFLDKRSATLPLSTSLSRPLLTLGNAVNCSSRGDFLFPFFILNMLVNIQGEA